VTSGIDLNWNQSMVVVPAFKGTAFQAYRDHLVAEASDFIGTRIFALQFGQAASFPAASFLAARRALHLGQ
jgi:hypothetical protein